MATVEITEYASIVERGGDDSVPAVMAPAIQNRVIDCSAAAAALATALDDRTRFVRIIAIGGAARVTFAKSGQTASSIATTTSEYFPEGLAEFRAVPPSDGLSVYAVSV